LTVDLLGTLFIIQLALVLWEPSKLLFRILKPIYVLAFCECISLINHDLFMLRACMSIYLYDFTTTKKLFVVVKNTSYNN